MLKFFQQGDCDYTLVENSCSNSSEQSFRVVVQNIPCGNSDVTCTKAVTFYLYNTAIHLTKGDGEPVRQQKASC